MPSVVVEWNGSRQTPLPDTPYREHRQSNGIVWASFYRLNNGVLIAFPGLADFRISSDGKRIDVYPYTNVSRATVETLLVTQAQPLALSKQGKLVLHGSAVDIDGLAIAFVGASGMGKSTLATGFAQNGFPFMTDDSVQVVASASGYVVMPSHESIRLWHDSHNALLDDTTELAPQPEHTTKVRVLSNVSLPHCATARPLKAIYFLTNYITEDTKIMSQAPAASLLGLVQSSFLLDNQLPEDYYAQFEMLSDLVSQVNCFTLSYPRAYHALDELISQVVKHTQTASNESAAKARLAEGLGSMANQDRTFNATRAIGA